MTAVSPALGRPAERKNHIVGNLRGRITAGELMPGAQLPTRNEIGQMFGASPVTVQSALEELRRDGFITVHGRQGTYVAEQPPHLTNYALVFPGTPGTHRGAVRFWTSLYNEADTLRTECGKRIQAYFDVNLHLDSADSRRLLQEVQSQRLAGLIFLTPSREVLENPLIRKSGIPQVVISGGHAKYSLPRVGPIQTSFWVKAASYLASRNRKRVAILTQPQPAAFQEQIISILNDAGLSIAPHHIQGTHLSAPELAKNLTHLLFHSGQEVRPDGLVIADDNLVEPACGGIASAGVAVPGELDIVAHCNFPWPVSSTLPVCRLGFDNRVILETCLQTLAAQRRGEEVELFHPIEAQFEGEQGLATSLFI